MIHRIINLGIVTNDSQNYKSWNYNEILHQINK